MCAHTVRRVRVRSRREWQPGELRHVRASGVLTAAIEHELHLSPGLPGLGSEQDEVDFSGEVHGEEGWTRGGRRE
jgi:hypothetical protein